MPPRRASHLPPAQPIYRRLCNGAALLLHWFPTFTGYRPNEVCLPLNSNGPLSSDPSGGREHKIITRFFLTNILVPRFFLTLTH